MQIYDHDSPESITFKSNSIELENWLDHFAYIDKEINSLLKIVKHEQTNQENFESLLSNLKKKQEENSTTIDEFLKYRNDLPKAAECEDVSCDMFYVNEHERYRNLYKAHLDSYRNIKEEFFKILSQ